jgi:ribosomal-protein-alanine N-acetyltransferase
VTELDDSAICGRFLEGGRIYLRNVNLGDVNGSYYRWMNDPEITQYLETRFLPRSMNNIRAFVESMEGNSDEIFLAICLTKDDRHIGNIKLGPINWIHRFADISLLIGERDCWGRGLGAEAIGLVVGFAFGVLNIHKLKASCYADNVGSMKAFEKNGFEREGALVRQWFSGGRWVDEILLGVENSSGPT